MILPQVCKRLCFYFTQFHWCQNVQSLVNVALLIIIITSFLTPNVLNTLILVFVQFSHVWMEASVSMLTVCILQHSVTFSNATNAERMTTT